MDLGIASVPVLVIIAWLACEGAKMLLPENKYKWLPVIAGVVGGGLGVVAMYIMPNFPGSDILTSIAIGIASGLAATGADQVFKQLKGE